VGEVIAFADIVQARRRRTVRELHVRCTAILAEAVATARAELERAPAVERWVRVRRLRKLEELVEYAAAVG
jgi:hypothetical protein